MEDQFNRSLFGEEDTIDIKSEIKQYLRYWPWFVITLLLTLVSAYLYLRYAPRVFETYSKVKILDESEGLELPTSAFIFKRTNINLENEIEIISSYLIMEKVVRELNLNTSFYEEGTIQTKQIESLPFGFEQIIKPDSINTPLSYKVELNNKGLLITNLKTDKVFDFDTHSTFAKNHRLPFNIKLNDPLLLEDVAENAYIIVFKSIKESVLKLKEKITVEAIGGQSDLLKLSIKGESKELSEKILNTLMDVFDDDGINDRQLVSKRTLDFIDERFVFLAKELDSIEIDRQGFKQDNNIIDIATDAELGLQQRTKSEEEVFQLENQLSLSKLLKNSLMSESQSDLLPANIGIENLGINALIAEYNAAVIDKDKLSNGGGSNNPSVKLAERQVADLKSNINRSLKAYTNQVETTLLQLKNKNRRLSGKVSQIPEQERLFKAIERQQKIKESLYLLLLQKREEAAINLAITEPSIKVVENALSGVKPISPKPSIVYAGAFLAGLLIPFGVLYLIFMLDTKLHTKEDVAKVTSKIPVIGEIPNLKKKGNIIFNDPNDRSPLAESFRILSSNVDYILPINEGKKGKVIYCTSTIKGEGKTYVSLNLSLALSSINKRVLLIGADLRNPQVHTHIKEDKQKPGLSNYLHDVNYDWKDALISGFDKHPNHHIILSGSIPPNPAHLLTNGRFKKLVDEAKEMYDYVVIDTAPTILVTDTMLISQFADATIYIARANYTEKNLLNFSKELSESGRLKNMAYVINSVGASKSYGYNYGYNYGYGSVETN
ncbi:tyrosine-protein kinase domain-containing protein [Winogradskyella sp.]|jgi:capsular exopolysaccharide synthesis family protein|uniref:GumC family protein n=1 Tax=Winogradskyella sp. TaxID=1883156 RepID=UPI0025D66213|nr:tyrosine-protein kinase domain-containing protein [Winogradskyella sp.]MCT4630864.1 polysaccharide biosynthesis tyrosine autokinase [Winogradskyella sp.]